MKLSVIGLNKTNPPVSLLVDFIYKSLNLTFIA